jgi:vacuolar-type H+-ATPase subunit E/Vma4
LIDSLWRDARREADIIINQARAEAGRIEEETRNRNETFLQEALDTTRNEVRDEAARILNRARDSSNRTMLGNRYDMLEENLIRIEGMLDDREISDNRLRKALPGLLAEAVEKIPQSSSIQVRVRPGDEAGARDFLRARRMNAEVTVDAHLTGGVLVSVDDGREIRDNTVRSRLKVLREHPPLELLLELFGDERAKTGEDSPRD